MNTIDKITTALTPGSIFNRTGKTFRSLSKVAEFAGIPEDELLEVLNGDLAALVTCKVSGQGKGVLVALTANIPAAGVAVNEPVQIAGLPGGPPVVMVEIEDEGNLAEAVVAQPNVANPEDEDNAIAEEEAPPGNAPAA